MVVVSEFVNFVNLLIMTTIKIIIIITSPLMKEVFAVLSLCLQRVISKKTYYATEGHRLEDDAHEVCSV